jgi:putative FmdB family regulatory protein
MPIYAYRCDACGFTKDVLQKISDPQLTVCLSCAQPTFKKQLTAAGFQLKGTGWYATDFRGGAAPSTVVPTGPAETAPAASKEAAPAAPAASAEVKSTPSGNA